MTIRTNPMRNAARFVLIGAAMALGAAGCGESGPEPAAGTGGPAATPVAAATTATGTMPAAPATAALSEREIAQLEAALDDIDQLLADLDADLAAD